MTTTTTRTDRKAADEGKRGFKSDAHARRLFGDAYDAIPKSVFATMAYYLASVCSGSPDDRASVDARLLQELEALSGQIIPERQGNAAIKAFRAAIAAAEGK